MKNSILLFFRVLFLQRVVKLIWLWVALTSTIQAGWLAFWKFMLVCILFFPSCSFCEKSWGCLVILLLCLWTILVWTLRQIRNSWPCFFLMVEMDELSRLRCFPFCLLFIPYLWCYLRLHYWNSIFYSPAFVRLCIFKSCFCDSKFVSKEYGWKNYRNFYYQIGLSSFLFRIRTNLNPR